MATDEHLSAEQWRMRYEELKDRYKALSDAHAHLLIRRRKQNQEDEIFRQFDKLGSGLIGLLDRMIETSISNPLLGVSSALIIGDVLYRMHIIDLPTWIMIGVGAGVVEGDQVAGEIGNIIEDFTNITHIFGKSPKPIDPTRPSATTVVLGGSHGDLDALMNKEAIHE